MRLQLTGPALMEKKGSLSETTLTQTPQKCDKENGLCNFESSKISSLNQGTIIRKSSWAEKFPRLIVTSLRILFNISKIVWFLDENVTATFLKWRPVFLPEWPDLFKRLKKKGRQGDIFVQKSINFPDMKKEILKLGYYWSSGEPSQPNLIFRKVVLLTTWLDVVTLYLPLVLFSLDQKLFSRVEEAAADPGVQKLSLAESLKKLKNEGTAFSRSMSPWNK